MKTRRTAQSGKRGTEKKSLKNYVRFVDSRLAKSNQDTIERLTTRITEMHMTIGLVSEVGELIDTLKRHVYYGLPFNEDNAREELGDILFYTVALINSFGYTMEEVAEWNTHKLERRYPDGFNREDCLRRRDKQAV